MSSCNAVIARACEIHSNVCLCVSIAVVQCGSTGPYLTLTVAGKVAIAVCTTTAVLITCLVLYQIYEGVDVRVSVSEICSMLVGAAVAICKCFRLCRRPMAGPGAKSGGPSRTSVVTAVASPSIEVEMKPTSGTATARPMTLAPVPAQPMNSNDSSGGLKDASTYVPKSGWRTKLKIGFSFFQVG